MLTEKEIQIVMNALNGTPTLTTSKFADKIETILYFKDEKSTNCTYLVFYLFRFVCVLVI